MRHSFNLDVRCTYRCDRKYNDTVHYKVFNARFQFFCCAHFIISINELLGARHLYGKCNVSGVCCFSSWNALFTSALWMAFLSICIARFSKVPLSVFFFWFCLFASVRSLSVRTIVDKMWQMKYEWLRVGFSTFLYFLYVYYRHALFYFVRVYIFFPLHLVRSCILPYIFIYLPAFVALSVFLLFLAHT